jgi:hypothetical protein
MCNRVARISGISSVVRTCQYLRSALDKCVSRQSEDCAKLCEPNRRLQACTTSCNSWSDHSRDRLGGDSQMPTGSVKPMYRALTFGMASLALAQESGLQLPSARQQPQHIHTPGNEVKKPDSPPFCTPAATRKLVSRDETRTHIRDAKNDAPLFRLTAKDFVGRDHH